MPAGKLLSIVTIVVLLTCSVYSYDSTYAGQYSFVRQDYFGLHDEYETPFFIFTGSEPGPVMILDGGIHGDEIASYMACDSIVRYIYLTKGTLIVIPRTNIKACKQNTREVNFDFNHAFPGDLKSDLYEYRMAYEFMWLVCSA